MQGLCLGASLLTFYDIVLKAFNRAKRYVKSKIKIRKGLTMNHPRVTDI